MTDLCPANAGLVNTGLVNTGIVNTGIVNTDYFINANKIDIPIKNSQNKYLNGRIKFKCNTYKFTKCFNCGDLIRHVVLDKHRNNKKYVCSDCL
jgi:hypothetical protein